MAESDDWIDAHGAARGNVASQQSHENQKKRYAGERQRISRFELSLVKWKRLILRELRSRSHRYGQRRGRMRLNITAQIDW